jgi:hypothetical protein
MMKRTCSLTLILSLVITAGCGGGGGSDAEGVNLNIAANPAVDNTSSYTLFQNTSLWINRTTIRQANAGTFVGGITYGDFNQDGIDDVFIAGGKDTQPSTLTPVELYLNNGANVFALSNWFGGAPPRMEHPRKALTGDFNGDGKLDIFGLGHGYDAPPFPGEAPLLILSSPTGYVAAPGLSTLVGFHHGGASADIDADGDLDVFVSASPALSPFFLINNGQGQFTVDTTRLASNLGGKPLFVAELVDVDKDGYVDLLVGSNEQGGMSTYICWGDSTGFYSGDKATVITPVAGQGTVLDFDAEDLDGDGNRDLVVTRTGDGTGAVGSYIGYYLQILINHDPANPANHRKFTDQTAQKIVAGSNPAGHWVDWIRLHDQNNDGHLDIVVDDAARNLVWYYDVVTGQYKK